MVDRAPGLDARSRALLDFERDWAAHEGEKGAAIRRRLNISSARYYQLLHRLIELPEALAYDPLLVKRLRRRRDERSAQRSARALADRRGR